MSSDAVQSPYGAAGQSFPITEAGRPRRRGVGAVAYWHGIGALVAIAIVGAITVAIAASPGGLNDPDEFIPGWVIPVVLAFLAGAALVVSFVVAVVVMGVVAPRARGIDLAAHGLAVSVGSMFVVPALWLGLKLMSTLISAIAGV